MGSLKALFDTNILIDYLNGHKGALREIDKYSEPLISRITWMEILGGASAKEKQEVLEFLSIFLIRELSSRIAEKAVELRAELKLKLHDAIIYATAREEGCLLITRNKKDFNIKWPDIREPYKIR